MLFTILLFIDPHQVLTLLTNQNRCFSRTTVPRRMLLGCNLLCQLLTTWRLVLVWVIQDKHFRLLLFFKDEYLVWVLGGYLVEPDDGVAERVRMWGFAVRSRTWSDGYGVGLLMVERGDLVFVRFGVSSSLPGMVVELVLREGGLWITHQYNIDYILLIPLHILYLFFNLSRTITKQN